MKKIPSLFSRDVANPRILSDAYHTLAEWVVRGEGIATRKLDGTAVLVRTNELFARYDAKHGKTPPVDFIPAQDPDPNTGHRPGWVPATRPEDKWIRAAADHMRTHPSPFCIDGVIADGTYEACGPKIAGNPERFDAHVLIKHGTWLLSEHVPRDKAGLVSYFSEHDIEGVVWWRVPHDDSCEMVKITGEALGVQRRARA
jgi:hypothetical protein